MSWRHNVVQPVLFYWYIFHLVLPDIISVEENSGIPRFLQKVDL